MAFWPGPVGTYRFYSDYLHQIYRGKGTVRFVLMSEFKCSRFVNSFFFIHVIHKIQAKSIIAALCQEPVPWSVTITNLAEKGGKLEHSLAYKIKEEHEIVPLKTVLRHYNIHVFDLKDVTVMKRIIYNILEV